MYYIYNACTNFSITVLIQEALKFVEKYGTEKVRLLEFVKNMGKGGAVRMVSQSLLTPSPALTPSPPPLPSSPPLLPPS